MGTTLKIVRLCIRPGSPVNVRIAQAQEGRNGPFGDKYEYLELTGDRVDDSNAGLVVLCVSKCGCCYRNVYIKISGPSLPIYVSHEFG